MNSILSQTYKDIKIIVVNDGFKENINEIIEKYLKHSDNIVYIKQGNQGVAMLEIMD